MNPRPPTAAPAKDSASLLVVRDSPVGPQIYMVRRHPASPFMANALVFVGGRLDEADCAPEVAARCVGLSDTEAAARLGMEDAPRARGLYVAAIRECLEESGLLIARPAAGGPAPTPADVADMRRHLNASSRRFADLLEDRDLRLPLDELRLFDHWITPEHEPRRYDNRFFACRAPLEQEASFDEKETTFGGWFTVEGVLEGQRQGPIVLAPPTLAILENLRGLASVAEVLAAAPDRPVPITMPRVLRVATEELILLLPGDHRYDRPTSRSGPEHYVVLREGRWQRMVTR
jgi:8-oxo-dGTP pyrophosphatase MutT (NUDIX family)